jgi:hypothetical protein
MKRAASASTTAMAKLIQHDERISIANSELGDILNCTLLPRIEIENAGLIVLF